MPRVKLDVDLHHDIIDDIRIKDGHNVSLQVVKAVIRSLKSCMVKRAINHGYCYLTHFFCIKKVERNPRTVRNPNTGEIINLPKRTKMKVVLSKEIRGINL
jgi:nucleoid DNA-binding protein